MAIDYALQFNCQVRKQIPEAKLQSMVKQLWMAEFAVEKMQEKFPDWEMETIIDKCQVHMGVIGPDGRATEMPVSITQIMDSIAPLNELRANCRECRANVAARDFGCMGKINYPISSEAEKWLLSRLPDDIKDPNLSLLLKFIKEVHVDGEPVDAQRNRAEMFEARSPAVRSWGNWFGKKKITSSQMLHMLAFGGNIVAEQAQLYTMLLNLDTILDEPHPPSDLVEQFKTLACAIVMAGRLQANVLLDA